MTGLHKSFKEDGGVSMQIEPSLLPSPISQTLKANVSRFWEGQDAMLDAMQIYEQGWFERRHAGTKAALEVAKRMCEAATPATLLIEYQIWIAGVLGRVIADGADCQRELVGLVSGLARSLSTVPAPAILEVQDANKGS